MTMAFLSTLWSCSSSSSLSPQQPISRLRCSSIKIVAVVSLLFLSQSIQNPDAFASDRLALWTVSTRSSRFSFPLAFQQQQQQQEQSNSLNWVLYCDKSNNDNDPQGDSGNNNNDIMNDEDATFYLDLQEAKKRQLGGEIPREQLQASAQEGEAEFLKAMKEVSQEFQNAKQALGSDGAVDLFINRIRKEEDQDQTPHQPANDDDDDDKELGVFE